MFVKEKKTGIVFKAKQLSTNGIHNGCSYQSGDYLLSEFDNENASSVISGLAFREKFEEVESVLFVDDVAFGKAIEPPIVPYPELPSGGDLVESEDPKPAALVDTNAIDAATFLTPANPTPVVVEAANPEQPKRGRRK